jgi:hypothetical protein
MKTHFFATIFLLAMLTFSCNKFESLSDIENENSQKLDTITNLATMNTNEVIWNDNGVYRKVTMIEDNDIEDELEESKNNTNKATCSNLFSGIDRGNIKKTFSTATPTTNYTLNAFKNTLQTDTFMRSLGITKSTTSPRVSQENRNVHITTSYLYAIKNESDGDFHIIMGDLNKVALTNCEASGLPETSSSSYTKINTVRNAIIAKFATDFCGKTSYTVFTPPILVDNLDGSLFFDVDHAAGVVGPTGFRPDTSWEIHPISLLQF